MVIFILFYSFLFRLAYSNVLVISILDFPCFTFLSSFIFKSTSYVSFNFFMFSFLCPITLFLSIGFTVTSTSFTFTFNFFIFSTIESYHNPDSTSCLNAG